MTYNTKELERQFRNAGGGHNLREDCETLAKSFTKMESLREIKEELKKCTNKSEYDAKKNNYIRKCEESLRGLQEKTASKGMDKHVDSKLKSFANELTKLKGELERESYKKIKISDQFKPNDHIRPYDIIKRKIKGTLTYHYAIYLGNKQVVHISKAKNESSLQEFKAPELIQEHIDIAVNAEYGKGKYKLFGNNCEHFATMCAYGLAISQQAKSKIGKADYLLKAIEESNKLFEELEVGLVENEETSNLELIDLDHNFTNLFSDSQSSGKLTNFTITDFGSQLKKAQVSFGNVNLGIYKQGSRKKPAPLFHDEQSEKEIYDLVSQLKFKGHYYASLRNFKNSMIMNFTAEDFARGANCVFTNCDGQHYYQTVAPTTSSFLAEKRIAKKRLARELEGVNDLFASAISTIQKL
ncbi:15215_t:CDS:2 [Funneliformis geosporum]|nr:15215_t:CDS:2 [Funneliformis geosporum]